MDDGLLKSSQATYTLADLQQQSEDNQILLAVWGRIFDVSAGKEFYGKGQSYALFAGHDCTKAFALTRRHEGLLDQGSVLQAFETAIVFLGHGLTGPLAVSQSAAIAYQCQPNLNRPLSLIFRRSTFSTQTISRKPTSNIFELLMSAAGYTDGSPGTLDVEISGLDGKQFQLTLRDDLLGSEVYDLVAARLPRRRGQRYRGLESEKKGEIEKVLCQEIFVQRWGAILHLYYGTGDQEDLRVLREVQHLHLIGWRPAIDVWRKLVFGRLFNQSLEGVDFPGVLLPDLQDAGPLRGYAFNKSLKRVTLPSTLQSLSFGAFFNQSLEGVDFPSGLQNLTFGYYFNQPLDVVMLPSHLQSLELGLDFNQSMAKLPSTLQSLTFGVNLQSLRTLKLIQTFNKSFNLHNSLELPQLENLSFGHNFNRDLDLACCPKLKSLSFGSAFNQSIKGIRLPKSLESLTFGCAFNQSLEGVELPSSLQSLTFGIAFNQSMDGINLPVGLQSLTMGELFRRSLPRLPTNLQRLALKGQGEHRNLSSAVAHLTSLEQMSLGHGASATASLVDLPGSLESIEMARFPPQKTASAVAKQLSNLSSLRCDSILVTLEDSVERFQWEVNWQMRAGLEDLTEKQLRHLNRTYWETYIAKYPVVGRLEDPPYQAADYDQFAGPFAEVQYTRPRKATAAPLTRESRLPRACQMSCDPCSTGCGKCTGEVASATTSSKLIARLRSFQQLPGRSP
eukprot:s381_g31.t3